ncbi:MAG: deoxyribose-phosphate aldolase [Verrucomicrobia bacterium]|nr:deoxyribose-phosphate aldolase [Verrucomicrobiota bacterium]
MPTLSQAELLRRLEPLLIRPDATRQDVERLCAAARVHGVHSVGVNGSRIELARTLLEDSEVRVTGLVGFPLGAADADAKRYETEVAIDHGAQEIETVLNVGRLKDGDRGYVLRELRDVAEAADERPVKVILELSLLTPKERHIACEMVLDSGAHCVCTGLMAPATVEDVQSLRAAVGEKFGVKATGLSDLQTAAQRCRDARTFSC